MPCGIRGRQLCEPKPAPGDWDGCWDPAGVDFDRVNEALLDTSPGGIYLQTVMFLGEMYPAYGFVRKGLSFLEFFQFSKEDGERKGVVLLDPQGVDR